MKQSSTNNLSQAQDAVGRTGAPDPLETHLSLIKLSRFVPYGLGTRLGKILWQFPIISRWLYPERLRLLRELCQAVNHSVDGGRLLARHLEVTVAASWRLQALSRCYDDEFRRWVTVEGFERFEQAMNSGRGVILLNSHYGMSKLAIVLLARMGQVVHSIERRNTWELLDLRERANIRSLTLGPRDVSNLLPIVYAAHSALKKGGVVNIAGDGYRGSSAQEVSFFGRSRELPTGFATLAQATGAVVVPVVVPVDENGQIRVVFRPPLEGDVEAVATSAARVPLLLDGYIRLLESLWTADPAQVMVGDLRSFSRLKPAK